VILPEKTISAPDEAIVHWIKNAADSVTNYFGHYPVEQVTITLNPHGWGGVSGGMTSRSGIFVSLSPRIQQRQLDSDWIMTHEMFHLAFPEMDDQFNWLAEGLATYLEPIARARMGFVTPEKVWKDMIEGCPNGQPQANDEGLNNTHTWGRTYWGGATFCLLADLKIREQTHNKKSLDDAMRAILDAGGNRYQSWTIDKVLEVGDRATGTRVLHQLYADMTSKPDPVDLVDLWNELGIEYADGNVSFEDAAPLSTIRESMTQLRHPRNVVVLGD